MKSPTFFYRKIRENPWKKNNVSGIKHMESNTGACFLNRQVQWARFQIRMQNPTDPPEADMDDGGYGG